MGADARSYLLGLKIGAERELSEFRIGPFEADDEQAVIEFLRRDKPQSAIRSLWYWKYKKNPYLAPSTLIVGKRKTGTIVGTLARFPFRMRIGKDLSVEVALEHQLRVAHDVRRKGLARELMQYPEFNGALLTIGSVTDNLFNRFHSKVGLVKIPDYTRVYTKFLTVEEVIKDMKSELKLSKEVSNQRSETHKLSIRFHLGGMPPFRMIIHDGGVAVEEDGVSGVSDITIEADYNQLFDLLSSSPARFLVAILSGTVKIKGSIRNKLRLLASSRMLRKQLHIFGSLRER